MSRLALLSYSDARFDGRTRRIARSAEAAGYRPVVYARWSRGLPFDEVVDGLRIVRVPADLRMAIPGLRWLGRRRLVALRREALAGGASAEGTQVLSGAADDDEDGDEGGAEAGRGPRADGGPQPDRRVVADGGDDDDGAATEAASRPGVGALPLRVVRAVVYRTIRFIRHLLGPLVLFPLRPMAWAAALEEVAEPADIWHGMWAGSLPALSRVRARHGGRSVYDSRDVYLHSRRFERMIPIIRDRLLGLERRWAQEADLVVTVNDAYADLIAPLLGVERPVVVRNCPDPYDPPGPPPDLIRTTLRLSPDVPVVLYQGGLMTERGIEQGMDAIRLVPDARLVLMGFGAMEAAYVNRATDPRYGGRVLFVPPVPPEELLAWTASADIMLMAIQPTTLNHRYTTPQKLWEAIAAGVPVVASDLPGMAAIVDEVGCGLTCDATDPKSIAAAIRDLLGRTPDERRAMRERTLEAAHRTYDWASQSAILLEAYAKLRPPTD